jgi:hypothetical protein
MHRIVSDELIPALRDEPGFVGALNLVAPDSGDAIMIVLWQSVEQAQKTLGDNGTSFLAPLFCIADSPPPGDDESRSVWEVTVRV